MVTGPDILVVNLLRFTNAMVKNMAHVSFTEDLDLTEFTEPRTELIYQLAAVVHQKGTLSSGHYKAIAKCPGGGWQELNDSKVTNVPTQAAVNPGGTWTPYVLLWTRVDCGPAHTRLRGL